MYQFVAFDNHAPLGTKPSALAMLLRITQQTYPTSLYMMMSLNGNIFRVTVHLCGEFTDHRWIPSTKASDTELCFLWSAPE